MNKQNAAVSLFKPNKQESEGPDDRFGCPGDHRQGGVPARRQDGEAARRAAGHGGRTARPGRES